MTVDISRAFLRDITQGKLIEAEVWDAITERQLNDWETLWSVDLVEALRRLIDAGVSRSKWPQSLHWDWKKKSEAFQGLLAKTGFSVMCGGVTQGLMFVDLAGCRCAIPEQAGQHLAYIEFVESAPWNRKELLCEPRFRGIGGLLMGSAIELSRQEGFGGRVGLHSLPQSEEWYRNRCEMTDLGIDQKKENLRYFEMTAEQASAFMKGN